jgi:hypothetical protein
MARDLGLERYLMRGMGEGYVPAVSEESVRTGVYGADWRPVTGLGFIPRSMPMVRGTSGLGALDEGVWQQVWMYVSAKMTSQDFSTIKEFFDGTQAARLKALKSDMKNQKATLELLKASMSTPAEQQDWQAAWNKYLQYEAKVLDSISLYNNAIWKVKEIKAYADALGVGFDTPEYLSGMRGLGIAPIAVGAIAIIAAAIVAIYYAPVFRESIQASKDKAFLATGDASIVKSYIAKLKTSSGSGGGGMFEEVTANVSDTAKWAVIVVAVFFGIKMVMDSGGLKGVREAITGKKA